MKQVLKELATKYNKDPRVIEVIVNHPFLFLKRRMEDDNDNRPIRVLHFGLFTFRFGKTIVNKKANIESRAERARQRLLKKSNSEISNNTTISSETN